MINPAETDRIDADIRARYPYPLAATFYRAYYDAPDLATIHEYLLDLFEVTLKYCASIVLAQYVKDGIDDPALTKSLQDLQRPSLGHWQGWLREILRLYGKQRRALLVPELVAIYTQKNNTEVYRAYLALRELMSQQMDYRGEGGNPSNVTTQQFFELLGTYRNKLAHGARLNTYTKEQVANILMPAMRELFVLLAPLADYRLVYISEVKLAVGLARRGPRNYDHVFTYLVGDRPRVSRVPKTLSEEQTVDPKQLYLLAKNEDFQPILSLHPFLIFQYCDRCSNEQAYVLNTSRDNDLTYLSYQCAHQFSVTGLLNDLLTVIGPTGEARPTPAGATEAALFDHSPLVAPEPVAPPLPPTPTPRRPPPAPSACRPPPRWSSARSAATPTRRSASSAAAAARACKHLSPRRPHRWPRRWPRHPPPPSPARAVGRPTRWGASSVAAVVSRSPVLHRGRAHLALAPAPALPVPAHLRPHREAAPAPPPPSRSQWGHRRLSACR